jgi:hypothetical protein
LETRGTMIMRAIQPAAAAIKSRSTRLSAYSWDRSIPAWSLKVTMVD